MDLSDEEMAEIEARAKKAVTTQFIDISNSFVISITFTISVIMMFYIVGVIIIPLIGIFLTLIGVLIAFNIEAGFILLACILILSARYTYLYVCMFKNYDESFNTYITKYSDLIVSQRKSKDG